LMLGYLFFIALIIALSLALFVSTRKALFYREQLEEQAIQVDESLDILDGCYRRIAAVAETPLATDDPVIQQLLNDIRLTKHAVLLVANKITAFDVQDDDEEEEDK